MHHPHEVVDGQFPGISVGFRWGTYPSEGYVMSAGFTAQEQQILASFSGNISPVRVSFGYGLALMLVALLMVLLPLIYLGIVGSVSWLWWWYAVHGLDLFGSVQGRNASKGMLLLYVGPLVIGGILVLFMFKPIFARAPKGARPLSVDERRDPFLFAFVRRLCTAVGAPEPRRIDITCEVNASASFRRGAWSMLGNDLVLTIGLPLVAGQNLRQFTGVLAHEFGHFAQGWAMRANYLIRTVNHWFARVVYQRDRMDEWLVEMANSDLHFAINLILHAARFFVWLTRGVLYLLMMIGHLMSSLLSRQMEFDADRHAFRLVGRDPFASALRELPVLGAAESGAHHDLRTAWQEKRLADDLPRLISANIVQIPDEVRTRIVSEGLGHSAGMYASHPATRDRIAAAAHEPVGGVFSGPEIPAQVLFRDFPEMCRAATLTWYRDEAGLPVQKENLVSTSEMVATSEREAALARTAERLLGKLWHGMTFFAPVGSAGESGNHGALIKDAESAEEAVIDLKRRKALMAAGVVLGKDEGKGLQAAQERRTLVRGRIARAAAAVMPRLAAPQGEEADRLRTCLAHLASVQERVDGLREGFLVLAAELEHLQTRQQDQTFIEHLKWDLREQRKHLLALREACLTQRYPFDHRQADITLGDFLVATMTAMPADDDIGGIMEGSQLALRNIYATHARALTQLAALAESTAALPVPMPGKAIDGRTGSSTPTAAPMVLGG